MQENQQLEVRTNMHNMLKAIDEKLKAQTHVIESKYKTNGQFKFAPLAPNSSVIEIRNLKDIKLLIGIIAAIGSHSENYQNAVKALKLKTAPAFEWCCYSYEDWLHDINLRVEVLNHGQTVEQLKNAKQELLQFLSTEDKLKLTLEKIQSNLSI